MTALTNIPNITQLPATQAPTGATVRLVPSWRGVRPTTMADSWKMAKIIHASGLVPVSLYGKDGGANKDEDQQIATVWAVIQMGAEVGLSPMASIQSIGMIGNKPGLYGPAMLAVVEASGLLASVEEGTRGEGQNIEGYCTVQRVGRPPRTFTFTRAQAAKANLIGKKGPWTDYPERMYIARARTFALRDTFPDALAGLTQSVEELEDIPTDETQPRPPAPELAPKVQQIELLMPGDMDPEYFPQTKRGLDELVRFVTDTVLDGGAGVVLLNIELLERLAKAGYAEAIKDIRDAAAKALAGEPDAADADDDTGAE